MIDATLDAISTESQRSIESHLADYESKLRAASLSDDHIHRTFRSICNHADFQTVADISADGVNRFAGKLRDEGRAARTIQPYLTGIKSFTKWLTEHLKLPRDPLASVKKPNPKAVRWHQRIVRGEHTVQRAIKVESRGRPDTNDPCLGNTTAA